MKFIPSVFILEKVRMIFLMKLEDIKQIIRPILKKWGVNKASLFGSYVRGEAKEDSDIDLLVELDDKLNILDFIELKLEIEDAIDKKVDLVEFSMIKPLLKDRILKEQVPIISKISLFILMILLNP